jgi:hypothetical protein
MDAARRIHGRGREQHAAIAGRCRPRILPAAVGQIVDMREWTFINPEISLYFFRPPEGDWILIRSRTRAGANGAGLTMATLSDRKGAFAEVLQATTFERRTAQAQAS